MVECVSRATELLDDRCRPCEIGEKRDFVDTGIFQRIISILIARIYVQYHELRTQLNNTTYYYYFFGSRAFLDADVSGNT